MTGRDSLSAFAGLAMAISGLGLAYAATASKPARTLLFWVVAMAVSAAVLIGTM